MLRVVILISGIAFNGVAGETMRGGQESGSDSPKDVALIQKGTTTICLGAIYNSFSVITSAMCDVDKKNPSEYSVVPAWMLGEGDSAKRLTVSSIQVGEVGEPSGNLTRSPFEIMILRVMIPGWVIGPEALTSIFVNEWATFLAIVKINRTNVGSVLAYGPPVKHGAIDNANVDDEKCNTTYNTMQKPDGWPKYMPFETFCIFPGSGVFNSSFNPSVAPGTACEDSIGSPVYARSPDGEVVTIGIVLWVRCSPEPLAIAIGAPEFLARDTVYTPEFVPTESTPKRPQPPIPDDGPDDPRTPGTRGTPGPPGKLPYSSANIRRNGFRVWCVVILIGAYFQP